MTSCERLFADTAFIKRGLNPPWTIQSMSNGPSTLHHGDMGSPLSNDIHMNLYMKSVYEIYVHTDTTANPIMGIP